MHTPGPRSDSARRIRLPRRTARLRLTVLYITAFLACGAAVLAFTYLLYGHTLHLRADKPTTHAAAYEEVLKVPVTAVRQAGRYDTVTVPVSRSQAAAIHSEGLGQIASDRQQLLIASALALAVFAVVVTAIGWILAGRVLHPLSTITAAARRISASNLHERLALDGPDDELKELADTLDSLFARLEASFEAQRRFAANASHELRTPLTRERTLLQVTLADSASTTGTWRTVSRDLLASNAEQERLIDALLTLASSEADPSEHETVDLAAIAGAAIAVPRTEAGRLHLKVRSDIQPATLDGDPLLVQHLVTNLIDNAVRHNIPDGDVEVATGTSQAGVVLSVANSGTVIPAAEVERLFQPFQRFGPRPSRRGHGLGLSIVKAIASAHTATISAAPRPGGGLTIDVVFPRSDPPPTRPQHAKRATGMSARNQGA